MINRGPDRPPGPQNSSLATAVAILGDGSAPALAAAATPALAPALDGSAADGAVIVVLNNQHANIPLKANGAARAQAVHADQRSVVADMTAHGATGITQLVSVNAIAARLSADEVNRLRANPAVERITPDATMTVQPAANVPQAAPAKLNPALCPSDPNKPFLEPEALSTLHVESDNPADPDQASKVATGKGVVVAIYGMNELAGNPNFVRAGRLARRHRRARLHRRTTATASSTATRPPSPARA